MKIGDGRPKGALNLMNSYCGLNFLLEMEHFGMSVLPLKRLLFHPRNFAALDAGPTLHEAKREKSECCVRAVRGQKKKNRNHCKTFSQKRKLFLGSRL